MKLRKVVKKERMTYKKEVSRIGKTLGEKCAYGHGLKKFRDG